MKSLGLLAVIFVCELSAAVAVRPHLYAVESPGRLSFLFGTRHSKIDLSKLPAFVLTAFRSRKIIAKEIIETGVDGKFVPMTSTALIDPAQKLSPPSEPAATALRARGVPEYLFTDPWICSFYYTWESGDLPTMDAAFELLARRLNKPVIGLDAAEDLNQISRNAHSDNSKCDIEAATKHVSVQRLIDLDQKVLKQYFTGDLDQIDPCEDHCAERSAKWIPALEKAHRSFGVFALFGVSHLAGPNGVIYMLKQRGYKVTQVESGRQLVQLLSQRRAH